MADPIYKTRPTVVLGITKDPVHVPEAIITLSTSVEKLGGSGDNIVDAPGLLAQTGHVETLMAKQQAMPGGPSDSKELRNNAYSTCFLDHKDNLLKIQIASNGIADFDLAAALIKRNGFEVKKESITPANPNIKITRKKDSANTIIAEVKAPNVTANYSVDWEYTYDDGETWIHLNSTPVCSREIPNLLSLKEIRVRARFTVGTNDPLDWMISNFLNI